MKLRFRLPVLFFIAAMIMLTSCSKTNKEGRYIPKSASAAFIINGESISAKLPWEEIKQNDFFKELYADTNVEAYIKTALDNPQNTGIDTKKNVVFFVESNSGYAAIEGMVKDAGKFKQFSREVTGALETEQEGIHVLGKKDLIITWDKEKFVIVISSGMKNVDDSENNKQLNQVAIAAAIYSLTESNSLAKDEKFTQMVNRPGDIRFWINPNSFNITKLTGKNSGVGLINKEKLTEDLFFTGAINFEKGRIDMDISSWFGKDLTKINEKYSGTKVNTDMIKRIPPNPAMLFTLNFKPQGLLEILKLLNLDGYAGLAALRYGFTLDDFLSANKGDILFSVSELKKDTAYPMKINAIFAASIADKNAFGKLIKAGNEILKGQPGLKLPPLFYNSTESYFALGTDKASVDKYINTAGNNNHNFLDKISGGSSAFYLNFKALNGLGNRLASDSLKKIAFETTLNTWENVTATGEFKDGALRQHVEINLVDKNVNSLKQAGIYFGTMVNTWKKRTKTDKWILDAMSADEKYDIKFDSTHH